MIWLGVLIIAATLAFIGLGFGAAWLYDQSRARYQARRKHVLHTTAADERIAGAERKSMAKLRELPERGKTIYTDRNVWLPWTPPLAEVVVADITTAPPRLEDGPARVLPACSCGSYSHWQHQHDTATSKLHDPQPEPVTTTDLAVPDSTFVKALLVLPLDRVHLAFEGVRQ